MSKSKVGTSRAKASKFISSEKPPIVRGTVAVTIGGPVASVSAGKAANVGIQNTNSQEHKGNMKAYAPSGVTITSISYSRLIELLDSPLGLISLSISGLPYEPFLSIVNSSPFSLADWTGFLCLPEKELLTIQKGKKKFSQAQTELILQIAQLQRLGEEILGSRENFALWIATPSLALEGKMPKEYLGSTFGIQMLTTELHRIEYGILA